MLSPGVQKGAKAPYSLRVFYNKHAGKSMFKYSQITWVNIGIVVDFYIMCTTPKNRVKKKKKKTVFL